MIAAAGRWTADEDERLKHLVAQNGNKKALNWVAIATRLQGRSDQQCREHWFRSLRPQLDRKRWTPEEDREILKRVAEIGMKWARISKEYMPSRCDNDIRERWSAMIRRKSSQRAERQMWRADEDERLKRVVAEHRGKDWKAIATCMQDRNHSQCLHRWQNHLRPQLKKSEWTLEEDQQIWNGVMEMGTKWAQIRKKYMPNRNENDISRRWKLIIQKARAPSGRKWDAAELEMRALFLSQE